MSGLRDKTIFITGSSRGIGREIALRCARDGANVVITGKTVAPTRRSARNSALGSLTGARPLAVISIRPSSSVAPNR